MEPGELDADTTKTPPVSLLGLLSNSLILFQTAPYISVSSLLALGATSKDFRTLIHNTRDVFRYLDLTQVKSAQIEIGSIDHGGEIWRNVQLDENVTEDELVEPCTKGRTLTERSFYGGPLRGIFSSLRRKNILKDVQTLILDGLAAPVDIVAEIITNDSFNVRILSIREVQHLNERKLQQALLYAIRPSRPEGTPRLRCLYIFGPKDVVAVPRSKKHVNICTTGIAPIDTLPAYRGVMASLGAQIGAEWNQKSQEALDDEAMRSSHLWYGKSGKIFPRLISVDWASTIHACHGLISFDAVLCRGPSKILSDSEHSSFHLPWRAATHALEGCSGCDSAPERFSKFCGSSLEQFPLLAPVPLHSSTAKSARAPFQGDVEKKLLVRCIECLKDRYCESCHRWWCEDCYQGPAQDQNISNEFAESWETGSIGKTEQKVKVFMGLCVENCLVDEMMSGAGSNGMWA